MQLQITQIRIKNTDENVNPHSHTHTYKHLPANALLTCSKSMLECIHFTF